MKKTLLLITVFMIFILTACGGGGGGSSSPGGGGGETPTSEAVKEEIRLGVLTANSVVISVMNSVNEIIDEAIANFSCTDFSTSISTNLMINSLPHYAYSSGQARLYNGTMLLNCNYFFNTGSLFVERAEVDGSGYITGSQVNSNFQGNFKITGSEGFLTAGDIFSDIIISDYFFINGPGSFSNITHAGVQYPDIRGTLNNVKVDMLAVMDLFFDSMSGYTISLGDVAKVVKDGNIYAYSSDCPELIIYFNGTNLVDVSSPCTSPTHFKVNVNTGNIIE